MGCRNCGFREIPVKIRLGKLKRIIREVMQEAITPSYRDIKFDPESGQIVDRNEGPVRGTEGADKWDRKTMQKWMQAHDTERVTLTGSRGREKEMTAGQYLSRGKVVPIVRGEPESPPPASKSPRVMGTPESPPPGHYE